MKFGKLKGVIGVIAPTLGQAMAGSLGKSAGDIVAKVLGCDPTPQAIEKSMQSITPDQLAELKTAELDFQARMKELEVDVFALETADVQDARSKFATDYTSRLLAIAMVGGFLAYIYLVTVDHPDNNPMELVNLILGYLAAQVSQVSSYYWGSSHKD